MLNIDLSHSSHSLRGRAGAWPNHCMSSKSFDLALCFVPPFIIAPCQCFTGVGLNEEFAEKLPSSQQQLRTWHNVWIWTITHYAHGVWVLISNDTYTYTHAHTRKQTHASCHRNTHTHTHMHTETHMYTLHLALIVILMSPVIAALAQQTALWNYVGYPNMPGTT